MRTSSLLAALLSVSTSGVFISKVKADSPTVDLTLIAPWSAPDILIEIAETVAIHNETNYFYFIEEFISLEKQSSSWTKQELYNNALAILSTTNGRDTTNFIKLSLGIHEAAPRIEAYYRYYDQSIASKLLNYDDNCQVWVTSISQQQICDISKLSIVEVASSEVEILPFDHIFGKNKSKFVVLYTTGFSVKFEQFHNALKKAVESDKDLAYIIRYKTVKNNRKALYLAGYGVEMALKNTDYLVIDDRHSKDKPVKDKVANLGKKFEQGLFQSTGKPSIDPLTSMEITQIGFKAAQYVAQSENPLQTLSLLTQDFPKYAKSVSSVELKQDFQNEILNNQLSFVRSGMNLVWINGKGLEPNQIDPFFLTRAIRYERSLIQSLQDVGFTPKEAIDVLTSPLLTAPKTQNLAETMVVFDVRDTPEQPFVHWWNDLEKDSRYKQWTTDVSQFIEPAYPGQLQPVRKNAYNLIIMEDLGQLGSLSRIIYETQNMIKRAIPIRFGMITVFKNDNSISTIMSKSLNYICQEYGKGAGMSFLTQVLEITQAQKFKQPTIEIAKDAANQIISGKQPKSGSKKSFEEALASQEDYATATREFLSRMGISEVSPENGLMFINGKLLEFTEEKPWIHALMPSLNEITKNIQMLIVDGVLTSDLDYYEYILALPQVQKQRNSYIAPTHARPLAMKEFKHFQNYELKYFQNNIDTSTTVNLWAVSNLDSAAGLRLALNAISFVENTENIRMTLIHNSHQSQTELEPDQVGVPVAETGTGTELQFSDLLASLIWESSTDISKLKELVVLALDQHAEGETRHPEGNAKAVTPGSPIIEIAASEESKKWKILTDALEQDGLVQEFSGLIINGRVVGPLPDDVEFTYENFKELYNLEYSSRIGPINEAVSNSRQDFADMKDYANVLTKVAVLIETDKSNTPKSIIEDSEATYRNRIYHHIAGSEHSRFVLGDKSDDAFLEIGVILDPLSETAQKWAPIFNTLSEIEGVKIIIHLNPVNELTELPLKRFYRYVFDKEPRFDESTGDILIPTAYFAELPVEPLYTLGVETTNAWHVTVRDANMDLDNILLAKAKEGGVSVVYELESILIEGHCLDSSQKAPPRGIEFEIETSSHTEKKDTLVMANLGYFQLKALPGLWDLGLREGRSSDIYSIEDVGTKGKWNFDAADKNMTENNVLALTSFEGLTVMPLVHKNPGMEMEDVLDSNSDGKEEALGFLSSLTNKLFGKKEDRKETGLVSKPKQAEINIFSVASGKLYERFLSIMIASVMKHTDSTVKFWFIENFLSPEFKDFVPHMAQQYGFDYEMVTYKWPSWLRAQTEKQRTIWGYKILFLDVLFPLDLNKVIFVDADQIVRTDLKELIDMDLQGAPYGYTPFCKDRTEMDGFRFWSEGYWKNHLRGKPYHISALYVVDLVRFRQLAAGDRLRSQYQQLSADPNSLANLDQDLPNNMQHIVPIFSLPQEWLWCETWCSDESLKTAKTIDLCNNPLTKEPKLDRARRQIPEWETYDDEIDNLRKRIAAQDEDIKYEQNEKQHIIHQQKEHVKDEL